MCVCVYAVLASPTGPTTPRARVGVRSWQDPFVLYGATGHQSDLSALWVLPWGAAPPAVQVQEAVSGISLSLRGCRARMPTHAESPGAT